MHPDKPCKQNSSKPQRKKKKITESITPQILSSTKCVSGTSFSPSKHRRREGVSYSQCGWRGLSELFLVVSLVAGSRGFWGRISQSCHCVFGEEGEVGRGGRRGFVWTGSKRCESGGAGIFTPRVCTVGGLQAPFACHPFDSIISCRFWRLSLISRAGAAFNTALAL